MNKAQLEELDRVEKQLHKEAIGHCKTLQIVMDELSTERYFNASGNIGNVLKWIQAQFNVSDEEIG